MGELTNAKSEDIWCTSGGTRQASLEHLEHLECSLQPSPPGCFTKKLSEARGNGIGFVAAGEAAPPESPSDSTCYILDTYTTSKT